MNVTRGSQPIERPPGTLRAIHFPQLALMDEGTKEGWLSRVLHADGGDVLTLPRTISQQWRDLPGHMGAEPAGSIHEVSFDFEQDPKLLSGKGWLADSDEGRRAALGILSGALRHNSVDLSEVEVEIEEIGDFWDDDFKVVLHFVKWKLAKTTLVSTPAFSDAHAVLTDGEVTAALGEIMASSDWDPMVPLVVDCPSKVAFDVKPMRRREEVIASAGPRPSWDFFHIPEPSEATPLTVEDEDEHGFIAVYGHLAQWDVCHEGILGECRIPPRPDDNYASWNKSGVLTDDGKVYTGPLCLKGGHHSIFEVGEKGLAKAYDDINNAWADVRMTAGVIGPWFSGYVRPGTPDVNVVAARASRISGHWLGARLKFAVSVNAPGYDVAGPVDIAASMDGFRTDESGEVVELFASLPACSQPKPDGATPTERFVVQDLLDDAEFTVVGNGQVVGVVTGAQIDAALAVDADVALAELELDEDDAIFVG